MRPLRLKHIKFERKKKCFAAKRNHLTGHLYKIILFYEAALELSHRPLIEFLTIFRIVSAGHLFCLSVRLRPATPRTPIRCRALSFHLCASFNVDIVLSGIVGRSDLVNAVSKLSNSLIISL